MPIFIALLLVLAASGLRAQAPIPAGDDDPIIATAPQLKAMLDVFSVLQQEAADPPNLDVAFYQGALPSMLRTLDPHSSFFDPDQFQQLQDMQHSEQKGFGSIVSITPGRVTVLQSLPGTPSARAGISAGDEIISINGYLVSRLDPEQLVQVLGASRQHEAVLDLHHPGATGLDRVTMSPELENAPTVDRAFLLAPGIGYLRITEFDQPTAKLVKQSIEDLGGSQLKSLILDLRDNPGGDVSAAVETASLFLQPDQLIFTVQGRGPKPEEARVNKYNRPYLFPLAILVNEKTASASEIVSGALQDHDRATILGVPTYGKGLVQQVYPLTAHAGMALTTAFYYTPSGRSIQRPLASGLLEPATVVDQGPYKTDSGREVRGGGGIQPDEVVTPEPATRLRMVMDASGVITSFANEYVHSHDIPQDFKVTGALLDQLDLYAADRSIQPDVREWSADRRWIESRLQQEILNLKFGVAKGDEIEVRRDRLVNAALDRLPSR